MDKFDSPIQHHLSCRAAAEAAPIMCAPIASLEGLRPSDRLNSHANAGPFSRLPWRSRMKALAALVLGGALFGSITAASAEEFDWQKVDFDAREKIRRDG